MAVVSADPAQEYTGSSQYAAAQQRPDTNAVGSATSTRPPRYPSNATVSSRNCTKIKLHQAHHDRIDERHLLGALRPETPLRRHEALPDGL